MATRSAPQSQDSDIRIIGERRVAFRDLYHRFLRMPWWAALGAIVALYLGINALFALGYLAAGGIANARPGSFTDAYYFSIQTMGTIGYGVMYPKNPLANALVVAESVCGLLATALVTGLVFAKFSLSAARIVFTEHAVISLMDEIPTLMLRVGNARSNLIVEAQLRLVLIRTERTKEGKTFYRMYDLQLTRDRSPALSRSWTVLHRIDESSPLWGETPASLKEKEAELLVTLFGTDDTSLQPVHARHRYTDPQILWGARHADILSEMEDGQLVLDLRRFHEIEIAEPTPGFPYPQA